MRWEEDGKEDAAMALSAALREVSTGHCTEQLFQLIYILCLLTHLHPVLVHIKTCRQLISEVDAMNICNFFIISIERHHRDSKDFYFLITYWHHLH